MPEPLLRLGSVRKYLGVIFNIKEIEHDHVVLVGKPNGETVEHKLSTAIAERELVDECHDSR